MPAALAIAGRETDKRDEKNITLRGLLAIEAPPSDQSVTPAIPKNLVTTTNESSIQQEGMSVSERLRAIKASVNVTAHSYIY